MPAIVHFSDVGEHLIGKALADPGCVDRKVNAPIAPDLSLSCPASAPCWCCRASRSPLDEQNDFHVCAQILFRKLTASVYSKEAGRLVDIAVKARRAGPNGLRFLIPASSLKGAATYFFQVQTVDGGRRSSDLAPNRRPRRATVPS
jgi:hypothetical protein